MTLSTPAPMNATASNPPSGFAEVRQLVGAETAAVDRLILQELSSDVLLINQIGHYIINSGGKRLRPMLLLLAAKALGYPGQQHITLAAVIEFIHTATLLHDDVVDESTLRRGQDTANALWGNSASVLVGDYLYSRSFELMVRAQNLRVMDILSQTTTSIAEGEVLQLLNCNNPATTEQKYLAVIARKTAILFSAAAQLAAVLNASPEPIETALRDYGLHLGIAFQLIDDALDYRANPEELGKNLGDDLADGKPTLPLIYAIEHGTAAQSAVLRHAIENGDREAFREVYKIIESTDAIAYTSLRAKEEANIAITSLSVLPASEYKEALESLARFSVERSF
ncbi:octaprenyl-diphosphate synthase [Methylomagnum ishizawai]|uniref:Octaprenyl diphosphate synthase n=1 Tax=Methylomagnum ishizawai TaxID=1760988 RepID=A0A1Y6CWQ4_9GAMM|nr:octaprenyl diphosphate synthase [Methylomagnum ishizawai]SMF95099.1 octaprenyl-diphosphate synthase [Methylomagnum ishizawai]